MARESHEKLDATAPAFSPSVVQLPQRRSGTDVQSQGETAPSAGGTTEMGQQDSQVPMQVEQSPGSTNHVGVSSSTEDSSKAERSASGSESVHRGRRRGGSFGGDSPSSHVRDGRHADDAYSRRDAGLRRKGDRRPRRLSEGSHVTGSGTGHDEGNVVEETGQVDGHGHGHGHGGTSGGGKGRKKSDRSAGANANHLLNFQFQPVSVAQSHGQHHHGAGEGRAGGRRGNGSSKGRKGGRGWGEESSRGPMSRDQFLQANFQFLLHESSTTRVAGRESSTPPIYQEAFFDPDVLVEWDTVDTVRLFRKVSRRPKALSREGPPSRPPSSTSNETKIDGEVQLDKTVGTSSKGVREDGHGVSWGSALRSEQQKQEKSGTGVNADVRADATMTGEGENHDDTWRCPICLEMPIAPRITKCGHGPFCLVCILRHLKGEAYARCPLCFDNVHREQLRRAIFQEVATYVAGGRASLLLLQRERMSLVPRAITSGETEGGIVVSGIKNDVPGVGGACPREGDDSERYSRIVVAKHSTLARLSALEQAALQRFRVASIASGETEWVPFVSEAQASVAAQVERFSSAPAAAPVVEGKEKQALRQQEAGGDDNRCEKDVVSSVENNPNPKALGGGGSGSAAGGGAFRFFQSLDGQRAFLHPLDMKQLMEDSEKGLPLPTRIDAQVLEVETVNLTPEMRRRLPFLGHLPVHCDISFLELEMSDIVSPETAQKFQQETQKRERKRRARTAAQARAAAREAKEEEARRARIAAMRAFTIDLQGPKPGDVQPIQTAPSTQVSTAEDTTTTPTISTSGGGSTTSARDGGQGSEGLIEGNLATERSGAANAPTNRDSSETSAGDGTEVGWSFARVTAMNGHFPSLPVAGTLPPKNTGARLRGTPVSKGVPKGAWENGTAETRSNSNNGEGRGSGVSNSGRGVWGTAKPEASSPWGAESASFNSRDGTLVLEGGGGVSGSSGKKKGRKAKAVSLFSNAGVRGGGR